MEYDPAFPTGDIMRKKKKKKKLSSIPLPGLPQTNLLEIPMPAIPTEEIAMPPDPPFPSSHPPPLPPLPTEPPPRPQESTDNATSHSPSDSHSQSPQPVVKFQMKLQSSKSSAAAEPSDSAKPKTLAAGGLTMRPPLKVGASHVKRMRAGVLPTGVLGSKKKPVEEAPVAVAPMPPPPKEPERFVPPTMAGPAGVDPSVTLTSEMLDAAKRAINQINSALLGVSNSFDASSGLPNASRSAHQPPASSPNRQSSNRTASASGNASSSPSGGHKGSTRGRSPASKRRRSQSGSRGGERSVKRRRNSSDSSSSRRRPRRRSRSPKRHRRRRSSSRGRVAKSGGRRRRSGSGRSRSPPASRRGRSRSLRKALSRSGSESKRSGDKKKEKERRGEKEERSKEKEAARRRPEEKEAVKAGSERRDRGRAERREGERSGEKRAEKENGRDKAVEESRGRGREKVVNAAEKRSSPDRRRRSTEGRGKERSEHGSRTARERRREERKRDDRGDKPGVKEEAAEEIQVRNESRQAVKLPAKPVALEHLMEEACEESDSESGAAETAVVKTESAEVEKEASKVVERFCLYEEDEIMQDVVSAVKQEIVPAVKQEVVQSTAESVVSGSVEREDTPDREVKLKIADDKKEEEQESQEEIQDDKSSADLPCDVKSEETSHQAVNDRREVDSKPRAPRLTDNQKRHRGEMHKPRRSHHIGRSRSNQEEKVAPKPSSDVHDRRRRSPVPETVRKDAHEKRKRSPAPEAVVETRPDMRDKRRRSPVSDVHGRRRKSSAQDVVIEVKSDAHEKRRRSSVQETAIELKSDGHEKRRRSPVPDIHERQRKSPAPEAVVETVRSDALDNWRRLPVPEAFVETKSDVVNEKRRRSPLPDVHEKRKRSPAPEAAVEVRSDVHEKRRRSPMPGVVEAVKSDFQEKRRRSPAPETVAEKKSDVQEKRKRSPVSDVQEKRRRSPVSDVQEKRRRSPVSDVHERRRRSPAPEAAKANAHDKRRRSPDVHQKRSRRSPMETPESKRQSKVGADSSHRRQKDRPDSDRSREKRRDPRRERSRSRPKPSSGRNSSSKPRYARRGSEKPDKAQERSTKGKKEKETERRRGKSRSPSRERRHHQSRQGRDDSERRSSRQRSSSAKETAAAQPAYKSLKEEAEERARRRKEEELRRERQRDTPEDGHRRKERRRSHSHSPSGERTHLHSRGGHQASERSARPRTAGQERSSVRERSSGGRGRAEESPVKRPTTPEEEEEEEMDEEMERRKPRTPPPLEEEETEGRQGGEPGEQKPQSADFMNILKKFDDFFTILSNMAGSQTQATVVAAAAAISQQAEKKEEETKRPMTPEEKEEAVTQRSRSGKEKTRSRRRHESATSSSAMSVSGGSSMPASPLPNAAGPGQMPPSWSGGQLSNVPVQESRYCATEDPTYPSKAAYLEGHVSHVVQRPSERQWLPTDPSLYPAQSALYVGQHFPGSNLGNEEYQHYYYQQQQSHQYQFAHQQQLFDPHVQYAQQLPWQLDPSFAQSSSSEHHRPSQTHADFHPAFGHAQGIGQVGGLPSLPQQYLGVASGQPDVHAAIHTQACDPNTLSYSLQISTDQPIVKRYDEGWITSGSASQMSPLPTPLMTPTTQVLARPYVSRSGRPETPAENIDGERLDSDYEAHDDMDDDEDDEFEEEEGSLVDGGELSAGEGSVLEVELGEEDHPSLAPDDISSVGDKELELLQKDELNMDNWTTRPRTPPLEEQYPDAPKPVYEHIEASEFRSKSVMRSRSKLETNRWVCDCTVPNPDEAAQGMRPCGADCINRVLNIECSSRCPISELCTNRQFQEKKYATIEPYYAGKDKGWGLRARDRIMPGTFVIEYVGEVIDFREFKRRIVSYEKEGHAHHYFMALEADSFIDAGTKGNWARFVNHSCDSNSETQKWNVLGQIRIGFFSKRIIEKGEEITIDYQFVQYGRHEQKCYCGASNCNGIMGSTSKQLQDKVRMKDTRTVERRLAKLLSMECLRNAEDVHMLLKVLVQEYLMRDIRFDLLGVVLQTESEACLKMFRQYNGLELIASYMRDSDANDWTMKTRLLEVLDKIPVLEQKQLRAGTNLFGIVRQWSVDPRFCRQRNAPLATQSSCGASGSSESARGVDSVVPSPATTTTTNDDGDAVESVPGVADVPNVGVAPESSAVLSAVDLETGEKTGLDSDEDTKHWRRIRDAAERLLFRWQQLPDEIYRIPKVERHETEQSLQPSSRTKTDENKISRHRSSVLSSSQSRAPLYSWGLPVSEKKRPASPSSRASEGSLKPGTGNSGNVNLGTGTPRLPKDEFRRLFEAYVRFEEEQKKLSEEQKKLSEQRKQHEIDLSKIHDPSLQDAVEKIRQLLSRTLLHAIEQLKRGMQPQLVLPPDLTEVAQDEKVQRLLGELQHVEMSQLLTLLSGYDGSIDGPACSNERGNMMMPGRSMPIAGPEEQLPPNWKWARDRDGRLYFYHVLTKKTQWEAPLYPWDAGDDDPHAYCYNNAHLYQVTHDEIAAMHVRIQKILKEKAKNEKLAKRKSAKKSRKDPNWQEKQKGRFHKQMYKIIASHLHKYRSPDTKIGRITNSSDLKYLGKKLAQTILTKELKRVRVAQDLEVNASVTSKAITYVDKYMVGRGAVYSRRSGSQKRHLSSTPALSPSELSVCSKQRQARNSQSQSFLRCQSQDKHLNMDEKSCDSFAGAVNDFVEQPCSLSFQNEKLSDDQDLYNDKTLYIDQDFNDKTDDTFNEDSEQGLRYSSSDKIMADDELKELDNLL